MEFPNKGRIYVPEEDRWVVVKNGVPGQKVRFSVNKIRKGKAEGRLLEVGGTDQQARSRQPVHISVSAEGVRTRIFHMRSDLR